MGKPGATKLVMEQSVLFHLNANKFFIASNNFKTSSVHIFLGRIAKLAETKLVKKEYALFADVHVWTNIAHCINFKLDE